ncbi:MAG: FIST C-terminal domain-containing protein, partial [Micromonosporaceae bacterium]|nr:FIST C-terminal domain-containing protein [Micromonosporaceae bacterium]
ALDDFVRTHPLAVARRSDVAMRHILHADPVRRSLTCAAGVPRGTAVRLASADTASLIAATDRGCVEALAQLRGSPPLALLVFSCAARRAVLGQQGIVAESELLRQRAGSAAVGGFYTYGEIARTRGVNGYHNQTTVVLTLS